MKQKRRLPTGVKNTINAIDQGWERDINCVNPFKIGRDGDRDAVCDRFEREILPTLDVSMLAGKDLVCWCAPERCHCDAILRKANAYRKKAQPAGPI